MEVKRYQNVTVVASSSCKSCIHSSIVWFVNDKCCGLRNRIWVVAVMQVLNTAGQEVFRKVLDDRINSIPAGALRKGFYWIRITGEGRAPVTLKLVVL